MSGPIRRLAPRCVLAACIGALAIVTAPTSMASTTASPDTVVLDPRLSPELLAVPVEGPAHDTAAQRYREATAQLAETRARFERSQQDLVDLSLAQARVFGDLNEATRRRDKASRELARLDEARRVYAVSSYIAGGVGGPADPAGHLDQLDGQRRQRVVLGTVAETHLAQFRANRDIHEAMRGRLTDGLAEIDELRQRVATTTTGRDDAIADTERAIGEQLRRGQDLADARLVARVTGTDLTLVVLDAYWRAAATMSFEQPGCGLRWPALAAIGRTESGHGTHGGASVAADGGLSRPIIGIPLDGTNQTEAIADSDGGSLDGDLTVDRAIGPMQFIPTSWQAYGRDGNGDGRADPQNVYDAALAAAALLCRSAPLDTDAGLRRAFLRYNNSRAYADTVLQRTRLYDEITIPPPTG